MLQNTRVTAFTVIKGEPKGGKIIPPSPTQIRVKNEFYILHKTVSQLCES